MTGLAGTGNRIEFPGFPACACIVCRKKPANPELATGDGKDDVENNCELCHSPRYITMQPVMPAEAWSDEVNKMRKTYGASIPDDTAQRIIQYLGTHYTPETRKR